MPRPSDVGVGTAVLAIRSKNGIPEVCLGLRAPGRHGAGEWSAPGGWVDFTDETLALAAARELLEEMGIAVAPEDLELIDARSSSYPDHGFRTVTIFYAIIIDPSTVKNGVLEPVLREPDKCLRWEWFPVHRLPAPLFNQVGEAIDSVDLDWYIERMKRAGVIS